MIVGHLLRMSIGGDRRERGIDIVRVRPNGKCEKVSQKIVQKNENQQVVTVNIGESQNICCDKINKKISCKKRIHARCNKKIKRCRSKKKIVRRRPIRSARRHVICIEEKRSASVCGYQESICIDYKMDRHRTKQLLWEAIGIVPTASLLIHNKSSEKALFLIKRMYEPEVSLQVEPHAHISMTITKIVQISSIFANPRLHEDAICYGLLTLNLQSTEVPAHRQHAERRRELAIKSAAPAPSLSEHQEAIDQAYASQPIQPSPPERLIDVTPSS